MTAYGSVCADMGELGQSDKIYNRFTSIPRELVKKRLVKAEYRTRRPLRKPLLTQAHRQRRLQWATDYFLWRVPHRIYVVVSDEARYVVYRLDGRLRVHRRLR